MNRSELQRYLKILGIAENKPSLNLLYNITKSHLAKIPFENISKLYRLKIKNQTSMIGVEQFLDEIETYHFGGTCYTNNYFLNLLLTELGFEVKLCGADMSKPDVHIVNLVKVEGREFIVDVGYAAPFYEPLPLDLNKKYSISFGHDTYVLNPQDGEGMSSLVLYRNGSLCHGYNVKPQPRQIQEFDPIIHNSYSSTATFMNSVLLVLFDNSTSYVIHNKEFIMTYNNCFYKKVISSNEELVNTIYELTGIPEDITQVALDGFSFSVSAWD